MFLEYGTSNPVSQHVWQLCHSSKVSVHAMLLHCDGTMMGTTDVTSTATPPRNVPRVLNTAWACRIQAYLRQVA
jgi:hypothetical protein